MLRSAKKKLALVGAFGMAGLLGCGLWNWAGTYRYDVSIFGVETTITQPNPVAVSIDLNMYIDQLAHAVCQFQIVGCVGTVNMGNDSWHAPGCTLVSLADCIGVGTGETFTADLDGKMLTETGGTVDTYSLTIGDYGFGATTVTVAR